MSSLFQPVAPETLTVLVTGATAGVGEATMRRFHQAGARVIAGGRRADRLRTLREELRSERLHPVTIDVRSRDDVLGVLAGLPTAFRDIDVLVNNAGVALGMEPAHQTDWEDWDTMVDTNVRGVMNCTRALLPGMCERNRGHVVNIGSAAGTYPYPGGNVYGATKAFIKQFSLNLRADLLGTDVRVTNVEPGRVQTEVSLVRFKGDEKRAAEPYSGFQPLRAADIAEAVFWCVTLPSHVNVNTIEIMPVSQAFHPLKIHRRAQVQ